MTERCTLLPLLIDGDFVVSQTSVVIDLKTYRERKAEERRAAEAAATGPAGPNTVHVPVPFMMPMFFMVWSTWVFSPQPAYAWNEGGSGAA